MLVGVLVDIPGLVEHSNPQYLPQPTEQRN